MKETRSTFVELNSINVNSNTEKKNNLTYLSWAWAWKEVKTKFPDATYSIFKDETGKPYICDDNLGYMCFTTVCINGETLEMWLPVMDGANKSLKKEAYKYKVKDWNASKAQNKPVFTDKDVEPASMFDINKTIMRCLVKNLAMFGLGIYIYAGEDLPTDETGKVIAEKEWLPDDLFKKLQNPNNHKSIQQYLDAYKVRPEEEKVLKDLIKK